MTRIMRGLTSQRMACGCVRGVYETYDGRVVTVIDAPGEECTQAGHEAGRVEVMAGEQAAPPVERKAAYP